ncbi:MAG: hypothetical protein EOM77_05755, partial [Bacteroidia bacterium]|nr:hypothetical protein [Bacteroidia bacterium]
LEQVKNDAIAAFDRYDFGNGISRIVTFMSSDLSSFYLDITKDILYCDGPHSTRRLQVQNVIYEATSTLMRLLTPFLPFTMDEVYQNMPDKKLSNVQLLDYPKVSHDYDETIIKDYKAFVDVRGAVLKKLEEARSSGLIGSSQEADVALPKANELFAKLGLDKKPAELARLFVVSRVMFVDVEDVVISRASGVKCPRCWNYVDELHTHEENAVCSRCHAVIKENK